MPFEKGQSGNPATQFKPGTSGNPDGRPPKLPELDDLLADVLGEEKNDISAAHAILMKWREMASKGNLKAGEMLFNRAYGMPKQRIEQTGEGGGPVEHIYLLPDGTKLDLNG